MLRFQSSSRKQLATLTNCRRIQKAKTLLRGMAEIEDYSRLIGNLTVAFFTF